MSDKPVIGHYKIIGNVCKIYDGCEYIDFIVFDDEMTEREKFLWKHGILDMGEFNDFIYEKLKNEELENG